MNLQLVYRYILSLSKHENMFYENEPPKKQKDQKKRQKVSNGESQTPDLRRGSLMC